jgi:hypothetical protein
MAVGSLLNLINSFFKDNNIEYDQDLIEIIEKGDGFHIQAKKSIKANDQIICKIPKSACLSSKTTGIADLLESENLVTEGLGLTIALLFEMSRGQESPWYEYVQVISQNVADLPIFWNDHDCGFLHGTEMQITLEEDKEFMKQDFEEIVKPLLKDVCKVTFDQFLKASAIVSSRAFGIDSYHGDSIVPLADLFDHKTGAENVHLEGDDVCPFCGSGKGCECLDDEDIEGMTDDQEIDEKEDMDIYNDNNDDEEEDNSDEMMEMKLVLDIKRDQEVYNTYGNHSNAGLLTKYGFCEMNNPFDVVTIPSDLVLQVLDQGKEMFISYLETREAWKDMFMDEDIDEESEESHESHESDEEELEQEENENNNEEGDEGDVMDPLLNLLTENFFKFYNRESTKSIGDEIELLTVLILCLLSDEIRNKFFSIENGEINAQLMRNVLEQVKSMVENGLNVECDIIKELDQLNFYNSIKNLLPKAQELIKILIQKRLEFYPTTLKQDEDLLSAEIIKESKNRNKRLEYSLILRIGEKLILKNWK